MKLMQWCMVGVLASAVVGCANTSEAFKVGPNTYQVTARATWEFGGHAGAHAMALSAATQKCESMQKTLNVVNTQITGYDHFAGGMEILTFSCI